MQDLAETELHQELLLNTTKRQFNLEQVLYLYLCCGLRGRLSS